VEIRSERSPGGRPRDQTANVLLERWRTDMGTQEQLRQNVLAALTGIFERGEEVPVVVSGAGFPGRQVRGTRGGREVAH
jgi:hypothetical protein